jgi:hypothetical protein
MAFFTGYHSVPFVFVTHNRNFTRHGHSYQNCIKNGFKVSIEPVAKQLTNHLKVKGLSPVTATGTYDRGNVIKLKVWMLIILKDGIIDS